MMKGRVQVPLSSQPLSNYILVNMKICKSALKDYFDEKDALDEYVIAKLTRQVYKLEQLPGGSKIRTIQKKNAWLRS